MRSHSPNRGEVILAVFTDPQNLSKQELVALVYDLQRENVALKQEVQRLIERLNPPKKKFFRLPLLTRRSKRPDLPGRLSNLLLLRRSPAHRPASPRPDHH